MSATVSPSPAVGAFGTYAGVVAAGSKMFAPFVGGTVRARRMNAAASPQAMITPTRTARPPASAAITSATASSASSRSVAE